MKLKINESFAASYNERRKKEELSKLKSKYGDITLDEDDEEESSSSDSDIDEEKILNDTRELNVLNALMTNDPRIKDPNFAWFADSDSDLEDEQQSATRSVQETAKPSHRKKQIFLRDIERLHLLDSKGKKVEIEEDDDDSDGDVVGYDKVDLSALKKAFLGAARSGGSQNTSIFTLKTKTTNDSISSSDVVVNASKSKDQLLLEYVKKISANMNKAKTRFRFMSDSESDSGGDDGEEEFEADSSVVVDAKKAPEASSDDSSDDILVPKSSQTEVKSHPRKIPDSMRIAAEGKKKRSEKNRELRERKRKEKESKKAAIEFDLQKKVELELLEYKRLKKEATRDRIKRIKRTADKQELEIEEKDLDEDWDPSKHDKLVRQMFGDTYDDQVEESKPVFSDDEELDRDVIDWDKWKPGTEVSAKETSAYEGMKFEIEEPNMIGEEEFEGRGSGSRRRRRRRRLAGFRRALEKASTHGKIDADTGRFNKEDFPEGFDDFLDKVYELDCEDVILGRGEGQGDIKCRFKYRSVEPMDYGLSAEEVLSAPAKELNSWVSLKKITQLRSKEEEERDRKTFVSSRRQSQKSRLLPTVFVPVANQEEESDNKEKTATEEEQGSKEKRKKKKKKKKKKIASDEVTDKAEEEEQLFNKGESEKEVSQSKKSKKRKTSSGRGLERVSDARISKLIRISK